MPSMSEYIVIGFDTHDYQAIGPFEVHQRKGDTIKDVQDRIAAHQAMESPHIIYSVMLEADFRQSYRELIASRWGTTPSLVRLGWNGEGAEPRAWVPMRARS